MTGIDLLPFGPDPKSILERFMSFHAANPHVYKMFCQFTRQAINRGRPRYSARTIWHVMRWNTGIVADDETEAFKLNDHYTPYYSRMFMRDNPRYDGFFETRVVEEELPKVAT